MLYAAKRLRIEKDIITRVMRILPGQGKLSVNLGQEVTPEEIIGSSTVSSGFRTINLATLLSVPHQDVTKYLKKKFGQRIYKGELLAYKQGGWLSPKKEVVSPTDGILDFLNSSTGELRMSFLPKKMDLAAGVYGIVEHIDTQKGLVAIKTQASKIYGVLGTGRARDGILKKMSSRDDLINRSKILLKDAEHILLGGSLVYKDAIAAAISANIHGIITGGLNANDYRGMAGGRLIFPRKLDNDVGITIVACEGFGSIPIGTDIYEILSKFDGRFVSIDGNLGQIVLPTFTSSSMARIRSTSLPKLLSPGFDTDTKSDVLEIKIGQRVRIAGSSFRGEQGKIIAINKTQTLLESGLKAYLLTIETKSRKLQMPSTNIEIIA